MWGRRRAGIARAVLLLLVVGTVVYHGAKFYLDSLQLDTRYEVQEVETENTEEVPQPDDAELIKFLQNRKEGQLVLVASYDDAAYKLTEESRELLSALGSQHIAGLKFRDSWAFLGYKGSHGPAPKEEVHHHVDRQDEWPQQAEIRGCAPLPTGAAVPEQQPGGAGAAVPEQQPGGAPEDSCATYTPHCDAGAPVYLFAGDKTKNHWPEICINGQYVIRGGKIGWRGLNVVVIDGRTFQVTQAKNFDTYEKGSSELEDLIWKMDETSLMLIATYDEASRSLSSYARSLLTDLGSSKVKNLGFRDSWVFIGQKGIVGVSPHEKHEKGGGQFGGAVEIKACLAGKLTGQKQEGVDSNVNRPRREFCETYNQAGEYGDFCSGRYNQAGDYGDFCSGRCTTKLGTYVQVGTTKLGTSVQVGTTKLGTSVQVGTTKLGPSVQVGTTKLGTSVQAGDFCSGRYNQAGDFCSGRYNQAGDFCSGGYNQAGDYGDFCSGRYNQAGDFCSGRYNQAGDFCSEKNQKESLSPAPLGDQLDLRGHAVFSTPIVVIARTALNLTLPLSIHRNSAEPDLALVYPQEQR
uniref:ILEI/PANDER domain-containing protein n=1 Tax=Branchiostoma floridae TaxID=7739 RepID=C4A026_BRAFL|eukprot:XP_002585841.1 hypothetical protein BRAFLDRAFT_111009 [Branchiostoma floridae]